MELLTFLGLDTVVTKEFNADGVTMTYVGTGTGDAGDKYVGLDRFGRIVDQKWVEGSTGSTILVDYAYGYDRDGNRLYQKDQVNTAMSELYAYDSLNRITSFERGTLNSTDTAITGTPSATESYSPDAAGNLGTANRQNELTALSYDANGNAITDDHSHTLVYDAWNRLVAVKSGSTVIAGYAYDALSRRILETHGSTTTTMYVSAADQVLVDGTGSSYNTYFWDPTAVDAPVFRDASTLSSDTQVFALTAATGDVAAIVNNSAGTVVERYAYDPYGQVTFLTGSYGSESASSVGWQYLHQGLRWDSIVDLYYNRARVYSPSLMRFLQNDPIGFLAGDANTYRYEGDDPLIRSDPTGLIYPRNISEIFSQVSAVGAARARQAQLYAQQAYDEAAARFPDSVHNGPGDAFRHCVWSALMANDPIFASDWDMPALADAGGGKPVFTFTDYAYMVGYLHEEHDKGQPQIEYAMDMYNNSVGRNIGASLPKGASFKNICAACEGAIKNGSLVWILDDGKPTQRLTKPVSYSIIDHYETTYLWYGIFTRPVYVTVQTDTQGNVTSKGDPFTSCHFPK